MRIKDNSIYIKGFGNELQIGFIDDDEYRLIMKDKKNVNDAIENISERNEFLHLYGPDLDDCYFKDGSEKVIEIDHSTDKYTPSNKIRC